MSAVYRAKAARESAGTFTVKSSFPARQGGRCMKSITLVALAAAALALGACKDKTGDLQHNVDKATADIKTKVAGDKDVKEAGQALKNAVKDNGKGVKEVVAAAKQSV